MNKEFNRMRNREVTAFFVIAALGIGALAFAITQVDAAPPRGAEQASELAPEARSLSPPSLDISRFIPEFRAQVDFANWPQSNSWYEAPAFEVGAHPALANCVVNHDQTGRIGLAGVMRQIELSTSAGEQIRIEITNEVAPEFARYSLLQSTHDFWMWGGNLPLEGSLQRDRFAFGDVCVASDDFTNASPSRSGGILAFAKGNMYFSIQSEDFAYSDALSVASAVNSAWNSLAPMSQSVYEASAPAINVSFSVSSIAQSTPFSVDWNVGGGLVVVGQKFELENAHYVENYPTASTNYTLANGINSLGAIGCPEVFEAGEVRARVTVICSNLREGVGEAAIPAVPDMVSCQVEINRRHFGGDTFFQGLGSWHSTLEVVDASGVVIGSQDGHKGSSGYFTSCAYDIPLARPLVAGEVITLRDLGTLQSAQQTIGPAHLPTAIVGIPSAGQTTLTLQGAAGAMGSVILSKWTMADPDEPKFTIGPNGTVTITLTRPLLAGEEITFTDYTTQRAAYATAQ
ncbi:MAG: hypothetical protein KDB07_00960 [Planctomycetes bacterium]|nr:hypothetical protein [Planctomycetota bacterium]